MEILVILFVILNLAFDVIFFIEIEKLLDNSLEIGQAIQRLNRRLIRRKGKK